MPVRGSLGILREVRGEERKGEEGKGREREKIAKEVMEMVDTSQGTISALFFSQVRQLTLGRSGMRRDRQG